MSNGVCRKGIIIEEEEPSAMHGPTTLSPKHVFCGGGGVLKLRILQTGCMELCVTMGEVEPKPSKLFVNRLLTTE